MLFTRVSACVARHWSLPIVIESRDGLDGLANGALTADAIVVRDRRRAACTSAVKFRRVVTHGDAIKNVQPASVVQQRSIDASVTRRDDLRIGRWRLRRSAVLPKQRTSEKRGG